MRGRGRAHTGRLRAAVMGAERGRWGLWRNSIGAETPLTGAPGTPRALALTDELARNNALMLWVLVATHALVLAAATRGALTGPDGVVLALMATAASAVPLGVALRSWQHGLWGWAAPTTAMTASLAVAVSALTPVGVDLVLLGIAAGAALVYWPVAELRLARRMAVDRAAYGEAVRVLAVAELEYRCEQLATTRSALAERAERAALLDDADAAHFHGRLAEAEEMMASLQAELRRIDPDRG